jgi:hypothetical protein
MKKIVLNSEETKIYKRMKDAGDYILNLSGRLWWANDKKRGVLVEAASSDEFNITLKLKEKGLILHQHRTVKSDLSSDTGWVTVKD